MTKNTKKTEDTSPKTLLVSVDDGYAQTKLVGECPDTGKLIQRKLRSAARQGGGLSSLSGGGIAQYETDEGETYTVSEHIESETTQFDGFHTSPMNRVLVNHAMMNAGYSGQSVKLVTSLPVGDFFDDEDRNQDKIEAKRGNLLRPLVARGGDPMPQLVDVNVGCQAVAAWFDYVLDDDLRKRNDGSGHIAIVDIGGRTTDVAVVVDGAAIDHEHSGTVNRGVLDVYKALKKKIRSEFKISDDKLTMNWIDKALRTASIKLSGKNHDISGLVEKVVREEEARIAREVDSRLGDGATLDAIVFVGGGSALFTGIANRFPGNGFLADDPEFANARGLYKYLKFSGKT